MKLSPFLLFTLTPLALYAHPSFGAVRHVAPSAVVVDTVQLVYAGERDDTLKIGTDSVARILKGTHLQVIFVRVGSDNGTRVPPKALSKIDPASVTGLQIEDGDNLVRQYGDVAKPGVLTVIVKQPPAKAAQGKPAQGKPAQDSAAAKAARKAARKKA